MMLSQEKIVPQTLVWKVGMDDWDTAQNVLFKRKKEEAKEKSKEGQEAKKDEVVPTANFFLHAKTVRFTGFVFMPSNQTVAFSFGFTVKSQI